MPRYEITSPDGKRFEVNAPDGATQEQVMAYAQSQWKPPVQPDEPVSPLDGMSTAQKFLAATGKGMVDVGRGIGQRLGMVSEQDVAESRKRDEPLMGTTAGKVGNFTGSVAALAPAMFVPGANTVAGAGIVGALSGAAQPTVQGESVAQNIGTGALLGAGGQYGIGKVAGWAGNALANAEAKGTQAALQNTGRDATLRAGQEAGYLAPPSQVGAGVIPRVMEGISGKVKTNQGMSLKNQDLTDSLVRKTLGLAPDSPITPEALKAVRAEAIQTGYAPVRAVGDIVPDAAFKAQVQALASRSSNAAKDFGELAGSDVKPLVEGLTKVEKFSGDTAVDQIAIFREKATDLYAQGNRTLGKAYRQAAEAIEAQVERYLASLGKPGAETLKNYREARQLIAKTGTAEKALSEGGERINAKTLGKLLAKGKPLSGEMELVGKFANSFPDVMQVPKSGFANPITALDAFQTAGMAGMGAGPMSLALPAARVGSRAALMNPMLNRMMGPSYGPGLLSQLPPKALKELEQMGAMGLLGSFDGQQ